MKSFSIPVNTPSASYEVKVGPGLLPQLGSEMKKLGTSGRCVVVSGEHVFPLYGQRVLDSLRDAGFRSDFIVFPAGENTKSLNCYGELVNFLTEKQISRTDSLIALGGGVTGDLTGFAAATYQRGIRFFQIPTTLLSAVDSSVGGKTAVNLPAAKNQVGAFYQPGLVLCDTDTLKTLPERELRAGLAEAIKAAVIGDPDLFDRLRRLDPSIPPDALPEVIESCVRLKAGIVEEDERDMGKRRLLNLGHSFGHAIEQRSGYAMLHGEAVAVGLAMICRAAVRTGMLDEGSRDVIVELLERFSLPTRTAYSADELFSILMLDKKIAHGKMNLVMPREIGRCDIIPVSRDELRVLLSAGCGESA